MARKTLIALTCTIALTAVNAGSSFGQAPEPIRYTLRFPAPHTHYVEVEATYPSGGRPHVDLFMAVWTPGSYLIREYERHVEDVRSTGADGSARSAEKVAKNRWRVQAAGAPRVTVHYRVYGREMTVRNNWIEAGFAMLNGAPTFLSLADAPAMPHEVRVELPPDWKQAATPLMPVPGSEHAYRAEDFDTLVDSPLIIGHPVIREFEASGKTHYLVLEGDPLLWDADRSAADLKRIAETTHAMWGVVPYPHYYFLNMVTEAGGGLEHKNSTLLMANRFATRTHRSYLGWLGLASHEFFHAWNVKRLRPVELGPFNYEEEVHSKALWIAEGFTDYYGALIVKRAGLSNRDEYLEDLSGQIETVQTTPGRLVTSVGMASFDTWIKQYRPDENTPNTNINYYPKGAVIAFLLDARIREATSGAKTLDDAMRLAYGRYSGPKGYTLEQFYQTMSEVAGQNLQPWFRTGVDTTTELEYGPALDWFGLRFRQVDAKNPRAWVGVTTRSDAGRLLVSQVRRGTPAHEGGLNVDDEILAIDQVRVRADGLNARLDQYKPGDQVSLTVARRDRLITLPVTLRADPGRPWRLEVRPDATDEQKRRLASWIGE